MNRSVLVQSARHLSEQTEGDKSQKRDDRHVEQLRWTGGQLGRINAEVSLMGNGWEWMGKRTFSASLCIPQYSRRTLLRPAGHQVYARCIRSLPGYEAVERIRVSIVAIHSRPGLGAVHLSRSGQPQANRKR